MTLLIIIIALALIFDYINGFHDAANSIATIVSTKVLTPFQAVIWAAFFNFIAYLIFQDHAVANTIGKTVFKEYITLPVILSGLIAAIAWNLLTWWYGIPSSSSHTLIGGFAGAAIAYAYTQNSNLHLMQIIDSGKILKTIAFIFLAPIIGMIISIIYTLVFINKNTWLKSLIFVFTAIGIWFSFIHFQDNKITENLEKFYRIDKNSKSLSDTKAKLEFEKDPEKIKALNKSISEYEEKITYGNKCLEASKPYVHSFEAKGADYVAQQIYTNVDMKKIEESRYADKLNSFFRIDQLKVLATKSEVDKKSLTLAQAAIDSLKPLTKLYSKEGEAAMINAMKEKYPLNPTDIAAFEQKMKATTQKDISKEVAKTDNRILRYFLIGMLLIFVISFIYTEKIKEPSAATTANLYKKLQLLSSAGFSIGHGGNDAQKVMGIIAAALVANGDSLDIGTALKDNNWVPLACYLAIGLGTLSGGWKIVKTMGTKITKVTPLEGVCAETAGATTLFITEQMGIPVSTTHTITGAIIGVGAVKRLSAVRWGVTINLLWAWVLTIPITALLAAIVLKIVTLFIH